MRRHKTKFLDEVRNLATEVGRRNGLLLGIAMRGLNEGLSPSEVAEAFASEDTGDPPLTEAEIKRAVSRAKAYMTGDESITEAKFKRGLKLMRDLLDATSPDERGFVRRMIEVGGRGLPKWPEDGTLAQQKAVATLAAKKLMDSSPVIVRDWKGNADRARCSIPFRREMAHAFLKTVFPASRGGYTFSTSNIRLPRARHLMMTPGEFHEWLDESDDAYKNYIIHFSPVQYSPGCNPFDFRTMPSHIGANLYSGDATKTEKGVDSYANKATVTSFNHLLVEFDALPLDEQVRFWIGVTATRSLGVLSLVWTTNKSIHGLVRVPEATGGDDLFGETSREAKLQKWDRQVRQMWRLCCSDEDPRYRCDAACKDCSRMTRFPGGWNLNTMTPQLLLWCAKPEGEE